MNTMNVTQLGKKIVEWLGIREGCLEITKTRDGRVLVARVEGNQT